MSRKIYFERLEAELADHDLLPKRRGQVLELAPAAGRAKRLPGSWG